MMESNQFVAASGPVDARYLAFLETISTLRPSLHRYCARMTGSLMDGEDVVQDALARAFYELSALKEVPALRSWLFRIAHNRALDFLRRYDRRMSEPLDAVEQLPDDASESADLALLREADEAAGQLATV